MAMNPGRVIPDLDLNGEMSELVQAASTVESLHEARVVEGTNAFSDVENVEGPVDPGPEREGVGDVPFVEVAGVAVDLGLLRCSVRILLFHSTCNSS